MGTLNDFIGAFSGGFVHPNLYKVMFSGNSVAERYSDILSRACKTAEIPGLTYTENKYFTDGLDQKFVSGLDYDPFPCTFLVDGGDRSQIIECMDAWSELIFKDGKFGYKENYTCDITFELLNRKNTKFYSVTAIDAYPTNFSSFELSSELTDTLMEYTITFNFLKLRVN